jgi:hypothetical protein
MIVSDNRLVGQPMTAQHGPVGMVGVGNMGGRITRRMTGAGYDVLAVDADTSRIPRGQRAVGPDAACGACLSMRRKVAAEAGGPLPGDLRQAPRPHPRPFRGTLTCRKSGQARTPLAASIACREDRLQLIKQVA